MQLRHLRRHLISVLLLLGLCVTGTSIAWTHARSVSAASAPYFTFDLGGQTYAIQYAGNAYSNQNSYSVYSDFGKWNEYTVDASGKWHTYGQFSGNEDVYFNGNGKVQGAVNVNVPGIGHVNTYPHPLIGGPNLPAPYLPSLNPSRFTVSGRPTIGQESYLGTRTSSQSYYNKVDGTNFNEHNCETASGNFGNGYFGTQTGQTDWLDIGEFDSVDNACQSGNTWLEQGDAGLTTYFNQLNGLATAPTNANGPVVASLNRPHLPMPVILSLLGGIFFIASISTANVCGVIITDCSARTKRILTGVAAGLGIISGVLGLVSGIQTALKLYATRASTGSLASSIISETAGSISLPGSLSNSQVSAQSALNTANAIRAIPLRRVQSFP